VQRALDAVPEEGMGGYPDYVEPEIDFLPSYKKCSSQALHDESFNQPKQGGKKAKKGEGPQYVNGFKNKKNQAPSYTDRVLFKNNTCQPHKFIKYGMVDNVWGSDHRPVYID
jgi:hypothetical protein